MDKQCIFTNLIDELKKQKNVIDKYLYLGFVKWDNLIDRIEKLRNKKDLEDIHEEQLWTFLLSCGYAIGGEEGVKKISELLTGEKILNHPEGSRIWLEVLPIPPREDEGNTHLDLALGTISRRNKSGKIEIDEEIRKHLKNEIDKNRLEIIIQSYNGLFAKSVSENNLKIKRIN